MFVECFHGVLEISENKLAKVWELAKYFDFDITLRAYNPLGYSNGGARRDVVEPTLTGNGYKWYDYGTKFNLLPELLTIVSKLDESDSFTLLESLQAVKAGNYSAVLYDHHRISLLGLTQSTVLDLRTGYFYCCSPDFTDVDDVQNVSRLDGDHQFYGGTDWREWLLEIAEGDQPLLDVIEFYWK